MMAVVAKMEGSEPGNFLCTSFTLLLLLHAVGTDSGTDETQSQSLLMVNLVGMVGMGELLVKGVMVA